MLQRLYCKAAQRILAAPCNALPMLLLSHLQDLAFPFEIADLGRLSLASRARLASSCTTLSTAEKLLSDAEDSDDRFLSPPFPHWRSTAVIVQIREAYKSIYAIRAIRPALLSSDRDLQKLLCRHLRRQVDVSMEIGQLFLRRATRFAPHDPNYLAQHVLGFLRSSHTLPPSVLSSILFTFMNAWPTSDRFQQYGGQCKFGCGADLDRLEHYLVCPKLFGVAASRFGISIPALPEPQLQHLFLALLPGPHGTKVACYIDCVRHAHLVSRNNANLNSAVAVLARLKILCLRHQRLHTLFWFSPLAI